LLRKVQAEFNSNNNIQATLSDIYLVPWARIEVSLARREHESALQQMNSYLNGSQVSGVEYFIADLLCYKGRVLLELGRLEQARDTLHQALALAESRHARRTLWMILGNLAMAESQLGNHAIAQHLKQQAIGVIHVIAADLNDPALRASFLGTPEVQRVVAADLKSHGD
jgi:tetratricopeptide (TPR) repeat protein